MATNFTEVQHIQPFDGTDSSGTATRWKRWIRAFELYAEGKAVKKADQKRALLLHTAGMSVQDIFFTLEAVQEEGEDIYEMTRRVLDDYFTPRCNIPFERHLFRSLKQEDGETVEQYVTKLRIKSETCDFGTTVDEQIRDQVIDKCKSSALRRKLLEKGRDLSLEELRDIARAHEQSESHARAYEDDVPMSHEVNKLSPNQGKLNNIECYSCGRKGHKANDKNCPARGQKCRKCKRIGHFEKKCRTKMGKRQRNQGRQVQQVDTEPVTGQGYAFSLYETKSKLKSVVIDVGGVPLSVIVDSGATCNIVDQKTWCYLKKQNIKCESEKKSIPIFAYGADSPLKTLGTFSADVIWNGNTDKTHFIVLDGNGQSLLGRNTAENLKLLQFGSVNAVEADLSTKDQILRLYPELTTGLGKLKDFKLKIPIDASVKPVAQPLRRIPYHLRDRVESKLDELQEFDIIEPVSGPCPWVSPIVCIPKNDNEIRLCVDMRRANEAVQRERHPIPTIDDVMQDFNGSRIFSKLDIKWAYHQIELEPESRKITVFNTHKGLFQYKRLMFGISCAPEMYQKVMQQVLQDCDGCHNILDDIIVHGKDQKEHDERLHRVLQTLRKNSVTLNVDKCQFNMYKLNFMGHTLSANGIEPARSKVQAVLNAKTPSNAAEVKSFLGLVNYSARFIPNMASITAPLRELLKKNVDFVWGQSQHDSFEKLKELLAEAGTLSYFDWSAKTQVIADASPYGLGAVLVQYKDNKHYVVSYASRSLSETEKRYSQTEKEALSLVWACERFHLYLYGTDEPFELVTDHKPLEFIYSARSKPSARIERWVLRLQNYRYKVKYVKGSENIADSLSRLMSQESKNEKDSECTKDAQDYVYFVAKEATPIAITTREIERASEHDEELFLIRKHLLLGKWHELEYKEYLPVRNELCMLGKLVLRGSRIVVPSCLRSKMLELAHEGHPGIVSMKRRLRSKLWWPGIDKSIEQFCKSCHGCQIVSQPMKAEPMTRSELPSVAWEHVAADLMGPLPTGEYLFVIIDYYSRFFEVKVTKVTTAERLTHLLSKIFVTHGLPVSLRTDNAPQFKSSVFQDYLQENGIEHRTSTPFWPQSNGEVERQNRSLLKRIRISFAEKRDWKADLLSYLYMYRSTPHSVTGLTPAEMLYGRKIRTKIPDLQDLNVDDICIRDRDHENKMKGKDYSDKKRNASENTVEKGDLVLLRNEKENKLSTPFRSTPVKVIDKQGNQVTVQTDEGMKYDRNVTFVKKYVQQKPDEPVHQSVVENTCDSSNSKVEEPMHRTRRVRKAPDRMPVKQNCSICKEHTYKYKCPSCLALYCSVSCYKEHKVTCTNVAVAKDNAPQIPLIHNNLTPDIAERLKEPDYELDTEETEDRVPRDQLELLGQSVELKAMLNNPHLREMLMALIKTDSPATKLDAAMQEPIFTEFADKCLAIINNNDENRDRFEIEDL